VPKIEVTFDLDANGILNVTALDSATRAKANITINAGAGHLSTDEIERMVASAEKMKAEDEATMARIEAKNALERVIYFAREAAATRGSSRLKAAVEATQTWLDESADVEAKDYRKEMVKLEVALRCVSCSALCPTRLSTHPNVFHSLHPAPPAASKMTSIPRTSEGLVAVKIRDPPSFQPALLVVATALPKSVQNLFRDVQQTTNKINIYPP